MEQVLVVGYGLQKKSEITGAIESVTSKNIEDLPLTNVEQALQGRAAGVEMTQTNGDPAAGMKIRVRGASSVSFGNEPLYVLDGVVVGDINVLNINDIESIQVLKDAAATAIYGSRAANGVVLVTTKKGKKDSFNVQFDSFWGTERAARTVDLLSPLQFAEQANEKSLALGGRAIYSSAEIDAIRQNGGTDWQDMALNNGIWNQNYSLSVRGGLFCKLQRT